MRKEFTVNNVIKKLIYKGNSKEEQTSRPRKVQHANSRRQPDRNRYSAIFTIHVTDEEQLRIRQTDQQIK